MSTVEQLQKEAQEISERYQKSENGFYGMIAVMSSHDRTQHTDSTESSCTEWEYDCKKGFLF